MSIGDIVATVGLGIYLGMIAFIFWAWKPYNKRRTGEHHDID